MTDPRVSSTQRLRRRGAEHELGGVLGPGELGQRPGHVAADDLVVLAAEVDQQPPVGLEQVGRAGGQTVARLHVHPEQIGLGPLGHPGRPPDEVLAARRPGDGDDHPLAGLPRPLDALGLHVVLQAGVDLVGHPQQGQLAQGREVARPGSSCRGRRRPSRPRRCCRGPCGGAAPRASCRPARPGRRRGPRRRAPSRAASTPVIRSTTSLTDSRCWMLTVEMTSMPALEQLLDVLVALRVARPGHVGVGQLVDEHHLRAAGQHGVDVELLEGRAPVDR